MTEAEWMACTNPDAMLRQLGGRASKRKRRLFNCACCRRAWHLIADERVRAVVEATERACAGPWRWAGVRAALAAARPAWVEATWRHDPAGAAVEAAYAAPQVSLLASRTAARAIAGAASGEPARSGYRAERAAQAGLLRDIFGDLSRPTPAPDPAWLAWGDDTVRKLATAIYEEGAFDRLPVLADALEEAGCPDAIILSHCRQPDQHVRGCWIVDAILNKT
jgi:hypothetical protein